MARMQLSLKLGRWIQLGAALGGLAVLTVGIILRNVPVMYVGLGLLSLLLVVRVVAVVAYLFAILFGGTVRASYGMGRTYRRRGLFGG
jgi:hypothetical protein